MSMLLLGSDFTGAKRHCGEGDIMSAMAKNVIHVSDKEAAGDFASLLARVRGNGSRVMFDHHLSTLLWCGQRNYFAGAFYQNPSH